jgi:hypothetical protein
VWVGVSFDTVLNHCVVTLGHSEGSIFAKAHPQCGTGTSDMLHLATMSYQPLVLVKPSSSGLFVAILFVAI